MENTSNTLTKTGISSVSKPFPPPLSLKKLLGPSFVILALGLGSGEVILWPYLSSNYGLGIVWGAILGITCQYFINMEIERYALIKGESVFVGINKIFRLAPYWLIVSTFIGFGLPGIIAASAHVLGAVVGVTNFKWIAIALLVLIGLVLSIGKTVYGMMERVTKTIIFIGVPFIFVLALALTDTGTWAELGRGLVGFGNGYRWWPAGMSLAAFFAAFAYSGAGGNLNLTQSIYVKEKGYGMGKYSQKIAGLFSGVKEHQTIKLTGETFELNEASVNQFKAWWKKISLEHLLVFWLVGSIAMALLMVLAYTTAYGVPGNTQGIQFVINEGTIIGQKIAPLVGTLFLIIVAIMLFQTQLGVLDSTSRIMAENVAIKKLGANASGNVNLSKIYFSFLWAQIAFGTLLFLFNIYEPKSLIVLGAIINAFTMFIHIALVNITNYKLLPKMFHPSLSRKVAIGAIFLIFGFFSGFTLWDKLT